MRHPTPHYAVGSLASSGDGVAGARVGAAGVACLAVVTPNAVNEEIRSTPTDTNSTVRNATSGPSACIEPTIANSMLMPMT